MRRNAFVRSRAIQAPDFDRFADLRDLEALRLAVRRELSVHRGQRALARMIGVCRGTLRKFVEMRSIPNACNLDKIRDWAVDRPDVQVPLGTVALALMTEDLPAGFRLRARLRLARELKAVYSEAGVAVPSWLTEEG